jgi:hypothetical protein
VFPAGDDDYRHVWISGAEVLERFKSILLGHEKIRNKDVRAAAARAAVTRWSFRR